MDGWMDGRSVIVMDGGRGSDDDTLQTAATGLFIVVLPMPVVNTLTHSRTVELYLALKYSL